MNELETKKKRGHNARITGASMLVMGTVIALASNAGEAAGLMGFSVLVAFAGLITLLVGVGIGRENKPTARD